MTTIKIEKNCIIVSGHSGYGTAGTDIICASISVASQFLQNITQCKYEESEDTYKLHISKNNINAVVFINLMEQLAVQYKDNVEVTR